MSASVTYSQTGLPATITITPGPGVSFAGQGAPGRGIAGASVDGNGHLQLLMSDSTTIDAGKIGRTVARITAAGSNASNGTPLAADVSIIAATVAGGCCVLPASGSNLERRVTNATGVPQVIYPAAASIIDSGAAGVPVEILPGMSTTFSSPDAAIWATS